MIRISEGWREGEAAMIQWWRMRKRRIIVITTRTRTQKRTPKTTTTRRYWPWSSTLMAKELSSMLLSREKNEGDWLPWWFVKTKFFPSPSVRWNTQWFYTEPPPASSRSKDEDPNATYLASEKNNKKPLILSAGLAILPEHVVDEQGHPIWGHPNQDEQWVKRRGVQLLWVSTEWFESCQTDNSRCKDPCIIISERSKPNF